MLSYIKFLLKSTNQHGVHSPFVYALVTRCFYDKKRYEPYGNMNKKQRLLYRLLKYFRPQSILEVSETPTLDVFGLAHPIHREVQYSTYDFVYFDRPSLEDFERLLSTVGNDSIWVMGRIYESEVTQQIWLAIKGKEEVSVTVDTFVYGLVFFRKEQQKEHFTIRV